MLNPTLQLTAVAEVSRRGRGRAQVPVQDAEAVRFLLAAVSGAPAPGRLSPSLRQRLFEDGVLVTASDVPRDVTLDPRLDVSPADGGDRGRGGRVRSRITNGQLVAAPVLPAAVARQTGSVEAFLPAGPVLWVRDPGSRVTLPYTLARRFALAARAMLDATGAAPPPALASAFSRAGVCWTAPDRTARRQEWQRRVNAWRRDLRVDGFAVLRGLFPALFLDALRAYYRDLDREGYLLAGDLWRAGYPLVQGEPVLQFLAGQLAPVVRQLTREAVSSTFPPYLRIYEPGAVLDRHRDQAVCRWNVDLVVGGDPAPTRSTCSPIWIAARRKVRAARLGLGDALLYRGTEVEHWRRPHPRGRTTAMASLHYGAPPTGRRSRA